MRHGLTIGEYLSTMFKIENDPRNGIFNISYINRAKRQRTREQIDCLTLI